MAEEQKEPSGRKGMSPFIIIGVVVLAAVVLALAAFVFVLRPRLAGTDDAQPKPLGAHFVRFPDLQLTGLPDSRDELPPILQSDVTLACDSAQTAAIIEGGRPYFEGMLVELYSSKTRTQLSEPFERDMIRAEAVRKCNALLQEVAPGHQGEVTRLIHNRYILVEQ